MSRLKTFKRKRKKVRLNPKMVRLNFRIRNLSEIKMVHLRPHSDPKSRKGAHEHQNVLQSAILNRFIYFLFFHELGLNF